MISRSNFKTKLTCFFSLWLLSQTAMAYVGPGAGLSAIGSVIALVLIVLVAILGFLWFPLKRLFGNKNAKQQSDIVEDDTDLPGSPSSTDK